MDTSTSTLSDTAALVTPYAVALHGYPDLPDAARIAAEVRYCKVLERKLGSPAQVIRILQSVSRLAEDDGGGGAQLNVGDRRLIAQWQSACDAARLAGFQGLGDAQHAWFETRVLEVE